MSAGSSLGEGIYLANTFEYSANYSVGSSYPGWMNSMYPESFYVVSVCEVISAPTINEALGIFVVPREHEGSVAVRYLLVYAGADQILRARISDGHILLHGGDSVDLFQHYKSIRQKYASGSYS